MITPLKRYQLSIVHYPLTKNAHKQLPTLRRRFLARVSDHVRVRRRVRIAGEHRPGGVDLRQRADQTRPTSITSPRRKPPGCWRRRNSPSSPAAGRASWKRETKARSKPAAMSVGANIALPHEQYSNPYQHITLDFHYFYARKVMFVKYASAFICFPGGVRHIGRILRNTDADPDNEDRPDADHPLRQRLLDRAARLDQSHAEAQLYQRQRHRYFPHHRLPPSRR